MKLILISKKTVSRNLLEHVINFGNSIANRILANHAREQSNI